MMLINFLNAILQDQSPLKDGFQPSSMYVLMCLLTPLFFGTIVGVATSYFHKILNRGN